MLQDFLEERDLRNLVKFPTCFKSTTNPSAIDHIITNKSQSFQNTTSVSTGLSDFNNMLLTSMRTTKKAPPKVILFRDMKKFDKVAFKAALREKLDKIDPTSYSTFENTFKELLDKHAPTKKKTLRANNKPYVSKSMQKAIMKRSELVTKFRKSPTKENSRAYKKQKSYWSKLYKKERTKFY